MTGQQPDSEANSRFGELRARAEEDRRRIEALEARSDQADRRADASEARADENDARADENDARVGKHGFRIDALEARALVDRAVVAELMVEGLVHREQVEHLQEALTTSRSIGAAIGIVMASRRVDEHHAFLVLRKASSLSNRKLRSIAEDVVLTGSVDDLPAL